jgi:hypothetical protein
MTGTMIAAALLAATLPLGAASLATARTPDGFSFRDLEYAHHAAGAQRVGTAEVARLVPVGLPATEAATLLRQAGAPCKPDGEGMTCRYSAFESVANELHELDWTVHVATADGRVTGVDATRQSLGD